MKTTALDTQLQRWWVTRSWHPDGGLVVLLFLLCGLFFWKVFVHEDHLVQFNDTVNQYYLWRHFAESQADGVRPLWLPFINGGEPFVANPQNAQFYPIDRILLSLFSPHQAMGYGYVLHLFLAGAGTYFLVRYLTAHWSGAFISAAIFMFSGYLISQTYAGHYTVISTAAWLPWVFFLGMEAVDRGNLVHGLFMSVALGLQVLAGLPQITYLTLFLLGMYLAFESFRRVWFEKDYRRAIAAVGLVVFSTVLGLGTAAIQLLPTYEFATQSARSAGVTYGFATIYSLPFHGLTGILLPNLFGTPIDGSYLNTGPYWEFAAYAGILPPLLIVILTSVKKQFNRITVFFLSVSVLAILFSLGNNTPLYWLLWKYVPGIDSFRVPSRFLLLFAFATAVLAGMAFNAIRAPVSGEEERRLSYLLKILVSSAAVLLSGVLVVWFLRDQLMDMGGVYLRRYYESLSQAKYSYATALKILQATYASALADAWTLFALILVACAWLRWRLKLKEGGILFFIVTSAFIAGNLWLYYGAFVQTKSLRETYRETPYVNYLKHNAGIYRVYDKDVLRHNQQMAHGIYTVAGYNALRLQSHWTALKTLWETPLSDNHGLLRILNVKYVLSKQPVEIPWLRQAFRDNGVYIYEVEDVLPKAFMVPESELESYPSLTSKEARLGAGGNARSADAKILAYDANHISLEVVSEQAGVLILSENYYPGWRAYVDGAEQDILRPYGLLRGIHIEMGKHRVQFSLEPESLRWGRYITEGTTALMLCGFAFLVLRKRFI